MLSWMANFLANTAMQFMGVTNMVGALIIGMIAAILGGIGWHRHRVLEGKTIVPDSQA
jgi:hypothetical protein